MNNYLPFIEDEKLINEVRRITDSISKIKSKTKSDIYKNSVDPFSAIFDVFGNGSTLDQWIEKETSRQLQKTLQNKVGEFHQNILGNCNTWEVVDAVIDIRSKDKKVIAEIKNKHNTTKGSDKKVIYNNLSGFLSKEEYLDYTGYYVEIIPNKPQRYNVPFIPSDNITKSRLETRENIRKIDGASFYEIVTGYADALWKLYNIIPTVIEDIYQIKFSTVKDNPLFGELFQKTFR